MGENDTEMTAVDNADETEAEPRRESRGVRFIGCDVRLSGLSFPLDVRLSGLSFPLAPDGKPMRHAGQATVELRTDMWPYWLEEAIDAAVAADDAAKQILPLYEQFEAGNATDEDFDPLLFRELKATMRAITSCAFAIDALYASVKARSPRHPHQDMWDEKGTARQKQVADTFRVQLRINKPATVKEIKRRVSQIFRFRGWAVHPGSKFRKPIYRPDLNVALDWHFTVFRGENAVMATAMTIALFDYLVSFMDQGSKELAEQKQGARRKLNEILDRYDAAHIFPAVERREPPAVA
jgi:hypothetical protein